MTTEILEDAGRRMDRAVETFSRDMHGVRTGRASPGLVENIRVNYQGTEMPLNQLAQIGAPDPRLIVIQPWDRTAAAAIERAILVSDLGMQPNVDGQIIRLVVPPLTEERRRDIVKMVRRRAEEARIAVRNVRRDAMEQLRAGERAGDFSQDESHRARAQLQQATDAAVARVDEAATAKEQEVMQV
ncbi:MAG: ribosome recycling factor [Gemmatimonadetes bacterium]|nr:ribosome recycling factor [Gemmatimonadota bacterium]